jgi:hypothetical protein
MKHQRNRVRRRDHSDRCRSTVHRLPGHRLDRDRIGEHTTAHLGSQAITLDLKPLVAINNWLLGVAGAPAEYLPQVSGLTEHAVTFDRRPGASAIVDTWLRDPSRFGRSTSPSTCSTLREPELHVSSSIARRSRGW